jgi:hypothetical protein
MAIELAGNAVEFDTFGEHWRCRLDSYACERAEFAPPGNPLEVPSPDNKVAGPSGGTTCGRAHWPTAASALSGPHDPRYFNLGFVEAYDGAGNPEAWARAGTSWWAS